MMPWFNHRCVCCSEYVPIEQYGPVLCDPCADSIRRTRLESEQRCKPNQTRTKVHRVYLDEEI